jgi:HEAT repeats
MLAGAKGEGTEVQAMPRRKWLLFSMAGLALLTAGALRFGWSDLVGWARGEARYRGRCTNAWADDVRDWVPMWIVGTSGPRHSHRPAKPPTCFVRVQADPWWWPALHGVSVCTENPPLQEGDPAAVSLLLELLRDRDRTVRLLASQGLGRVGPAAKEAVPALRDLALHDEDEAVRATAQDALTRIDPE